MKRLAATVVAIGGVVVASWLIGRPSLSAPRGAAQNRPASFQGDLIATIAERVTDGVGRGVAQHVERTMGFENLGGTATLTADLDALGFVVAATYDRPGERHVTFAKGAITVDGQARGTLAGPVVLLDLVHRLRVTSTTPATLLELSSLEQLSVRIERRGPAIVVVAVGDGDGEVVVRAMPEGQRIGPGAFAEGDAPPALSRAPVEITLPGARSVAGMAIRPRGAPPPALDDAVSPADAAASAFIESDSDAVVAFARPLCAEQALETGRRVATAVHALVDPAKTAVTPSAVRMLAAGGDCDGAAALAVAAMRVCGHPARAIVGYVLVEPGTPQARLVPHAVAAVYRLPHNGEVSGGWWRLDATVPAITDHDDRFIPVAAGLGGALTMGRLLGVIDASDVVDAPSPLGLADGGLEHHAGP